MLKDTKMEWICANKFKGSLLKETVHYSIMPCNRVAARMQILLSNTALIGLNIVSSTTVVTFKSLLIAETEGEEHGFVRLHRHYNSRYSH